MLRGALNGKQKAAAFMISLGPELSSKIFKHMNEDEIESLTLEIASMQKVSPEEKDRLRQEFHEMIQAQDFISQGGIEYAKDLLERALGSSKAIDIINRLTASLQIRPFDFIRHSDPAQVLSFVQNEHPQTIAMILAYLPAEQASLIISSLSPDLQVDVAKRIALMDRTSPDIVQQVEKVLERKLANSWAQESSSVGGVEAAVNILNRVDRSTEKTILESLEINEPALAEEIKKRMFVFEDVVLLDDRSIQRVLREVDMSKDLPLALKAVSDEVKDRIFHNISKNAAQNLKENIEYLGPVRLRDVEDAQQRIVNIIRRLEEEGEVIISRGGGEDIVV